MGNQGCEIKFHLEHKSLIFFAKMALHLSRATLKTNKLADVCPQCLLAIRCYKRCVVVGLCVCLQQSWFFFFLCSLPTSEPFDPPTQLSQCSSGSLSTSLQCAHQRPPCLISYICHTFTNKERQQLVTMHTFFLKRAKVLEWCQRMSGCLKPSDGKNKSVHKTIQNRNRSCLSLCRWFPTFCFACFSHSQKYVLHHSHCARVFWLPVKKCEANSCSPMPSLYAMYDSLHRQMLWINSLLPYNC